MSGSLVHLSLTVAELRTAGVTTETHDEPGHVSLKCLDPDGYEIEVYAEG